MGSTSTSKAISTGTTEDVVRVCMHILEDGEQYIYRHDLEEKCVGTLSTNRHEEMVVIKPLTLPPECKLTEGFLTLFDDYALRPPFIYQPNETPKWQRFLTTNVGKGTALWERFWFRLEIIDDPNCKSNNVDVEDNEVNSRTRQQTIVLRYWLYPEHAEQQRKVCLIFNNMLY